MKRWLLVVLALLLSAPAFASDVTVTASVDRSKVELGQSIRMVADVSYDPRRDPHPPEAEKIALPPFEVLDAVATPMPEAGGRRVLRYTIRLVAWRTGRLTIPPLRVGAARSAPIAVDVEKPPATKTDRPGEIRGLKPPTAIAVPPWVWALGIAILAALAALLWKGIRRLARRRRPAPPPLPPHLQALRDLDALAAARLIAAGRLREHYERLADVLRAYLRGRFAMPLELTTAELIAAMRAAGLEDALCAAVRGILDEADLVKFARLAPPAEHAEGQMLAVRALVQRTRPVDPQAVGEAAAC